VARLTIPQRLVPRAIIVTDDDLRGDGISESGVLPISRIQNIKKWRLQPGKNVPDFRLEAGASMMTRKLKKITYANAKALRVVGSIRCVFNLDDIKLHENQLPTTSRRKHRQEKYRASLALTRQAGIG